MPENIVINFTGDTSGLQPVENALDEIIQQSGEVGQAWEKAAGKMDAANKANISNTTKLGQAIQKLSDAAKSMDKAVIGGAYKDYLKQIQAQLVLTNKDLIAYIKNAKIAAQQAVFSAQTQEEAEALTLTIHAMNEELANLEAAEAAVANSTASFSAEVENAGTASLSLRARLRQAKDELIAMADAGLAGTPAFIELQQRAGELNDQMADLNQTISGLGSDTAVLDGIISATSGLAGGFAVAQGAASLFGAGEEAVQAALLKVNSAMAILQGLQQIQLVLQKESAAMLFLQSARTKALAVVQQFLALTTLETVAATTALRAALIATGIGAIVVLVGSLIMAYDALTSSTEDYAKAIEKTNLRLDQNTEKLQGNLAAVDLAAKKAKLLAEIAGKSEEEIFEIEKKGAQRRLATVTGVLGQIEAEYAKNRAKLKKAEETEQRARENGQFVSVPEELVNQDIELRKRVVEARKLQQEEINALTTADLERQKEVADEAREAAKKAADDAAADSKEAAERRKAIAEANARAEYEIKKRGIERLIELDNKVLDDEAKDNFLKLFALQEFYLNSLKLIELNRSEELRQDELTATQRKNINDKFNLERIRALEANEVKRIAIVKASAEAEKAEQEALLTSLIDGEAARFTRIQEGINQIYATINQSNSKEQDEDLALLESKYKQGLITYEEYERRRLLIKAEYARRILGNELAMLEAQRAANVAAGKSVIDIDKAIYAAKDALRQADIDKEKAANEKKAADKKTSDDKQIELEKQIKQAAFDLGKQAADSIFQAGADRRANELQGRLSALDAARQAELDNKNLTEQQKADIDRKYNEKERQIKQKAYEDDKRAKIAQAIINGALAITNIFATVPKFDFGVSTFILAGVAAASTAIQVAAIKAAPVPKFRHGKVGIEGPGTTTSDSIPAMISRGESVINAKSTEKWKDALEAINNDDFDNYLSRKFGDFVFPEVPESIHVAPGGGMAIDYDQLAMKVAAHMKGIIPAPAQIHNTIDGEGFKTYVQNGHNRTEYKNKRYSMS